MRRSFDERDMQAGGAVARRTAPTESRAAAAARLAGAPSGSDAVRRRLAEAARRAERAAFDRPDTRSAAGPPATSRQPAPPRPDRRSADARPVGSPSPGGRAAAPRSPEGRSAEGRTAERRSSQSRSMEAHPAHGRSPQGRTSQGRSGEARSSQGRSTGGRPAAAARRARAIADPSAVAGIFSAGAAGLAAAPAEPAQPAPKEQPRPRHLKVVEPGTLSPRQRRRRARAALVAAIAAGSFIAFALVYLHVVLAQRQFHIDRLNANVSKAQTSYQNLRLQVAQLGSPQQIISTAEGRLGMVQPQKVVYLTPPAGAPASTGPQGGQTGQSTGRSVHRAGRVGGEQRRCARRQRRLAHNQVTAGRRAVTTRPSGGGRERSGGDGPHKPHRPYRPVHRAPRRGLAPTGRARAFMMLVVVVVVFAVICVKLVAIQGFDSARYLAVGGSEWEQTVALPGERGAILDRNGYELAMSVPQTTIYADPHQVSNAAAEAAALAPVLGIAPSTLQHELSENTSFVYLARTLPDSTAKKVAALDLAGIYSLSEPKRFYPAGQLVSPLLGLVGTEGRGLSGLEYKYNSLLSGRSGKEVEETDPQGRLLPGGVQSYQAPVAGQDLVLSIDEPLQYQAEQALAQALVAADAHRGIALLMDTRTGDILADAELGIPPAGSTQTPAVPVSIPAPPGSSGPQAQPVEEPAATSFTDVYEPGSVNKLITISAALQLGVIKPSDTFTIPNSYPVADSVFHDAEAHPTEHWTVTDILANSSNIGTIQIAQRLGRTQLMNFIGDYGLGSVTDISFPGESRGLLPSYWSGTSIADVPIGQGIAVTAIQMLAAYNTVANGGVYVPPRLVDATIDGSGQEHLLPMAPQHRVVSTAVAQEMTTMLDEVVRVGTGTAADLDPYTVAGKTGTGLVPSPKGGYESGHYVASFAGFVPAEQPRITGMVVVDDTPDFGAAASAPTFATIARDALEKLSIPPMPKEPPAPGVPLATTQSATGAGEVAGAPLPGLSAPVSAATATGSAPAGQGGTAGQGGSNAPAGTTATTRPGNGTVPAGTGTTLPEPAAAGRPPSSSGGG